MCAWTKIESVLSNRDLVYRTIEDLVSLMKMTPIFPPYVFEYQGTKSDEWGISGICLIAESHLSIHTWPDYNQIQIDCYSCREFDVRTMLNYVIDRYEIETFDGFVCDRSVGQRIGEPQSIAEILSSNRQPT